MARIRTAAVLAVVGLATPALGNGPTPDPRDDVRALYDAAIAAPDDPTRRAALEARLPWVDALQVYVLEGDLLISRAALRDYLKRRHEERMRLAMAKGQAPGATPNPFAIGELLSPELKVNYVLGRPDLWRRELRGKLTYAVDRASFGGDNSQYQAVVRNLARAAEEWEQLCPACGIDFNHVAAADAVPSFDQALIIVRAQDVGGEFIAAAPFPSTPVDQRYLYVDPSYFTTNYDRVGVFRHELGHALGYRHEQLDALSACSHLENDEWKALSDYDSDSVMHYFCNGRGSLALEFSCTDRVSHAKAYEP